MIGSDASGLLQNVHLNSNLYTPVPIHPRLCVVLYIPQYSTCYTVLYMYSCMQSNILSSEHAHTWTLRTITANPRNASLPPASASLEGPADVCPRAAARVSGGGGINPTGSSLTALWPSLRLTPRGNASLASSPGPSMSIAKIS
jgi:hypothetical protein